MRRLVLLRSICGPLVVGFVLLGAPLSAAEGPFTAEPGYVACERATLAPDLIIGGLAYAADGSLLVYAGADLLRLSADGSRSVLTSFDSPVFGSFVVRAPTPGVVLFGESSAGNIYSVPLDGSERSLLDQISNNYALAFDPEGRGYVSRGANGRQEIVLLDADPGNTPRPVIVNMPGFSGPIAVDDTGNLYYGTADFLASSQSLHRFLQAQLEAAVTGDPVDFSAGELVLGGFGGFSQMLFHADHLIFSDLGFTTGAGRVERLALAGGFEMESLFVTPHPDGVVSATHIAMFGGDSDFAAGAGSTGGQLAVVYSDFVSVQGLTEIRPQLFFVRGELNSDGRFDLSDVVWFLNFFFLGGPEPTLIEAADMNGDGELDIGDAVFGLSHLFLAGPPLPPPFPELGPAL